MSSLKTSSCFCISHLLNLHAGRRLFIVISKCYTCSAIYIVMAIKSGRVIAWKAITTVEVAGLRGSRHNSYLVAQLTALATSNTTMVHLAVFSGNRNYDYKMPMYLSSASCAIHVQYMCSTCAVHVQYILSANSLSGLQSRHWLLSLSGLQSPHQQVLLLSSQHWRDESPPSSHAVHMVVVQTLTTWRGPKIVLF